MLSIGEFSKICSVTTKTLRYYDEIGLIKPIHINNENGYRFYDISQLKTMLTIDRLKGYELSLEEIARILKDDSDELLLQKISHKEKELRTRMEGYSLLLSNLKNDINNLKKGVGLMSHLDEMEVKLVERGPVNILSTRQKMNTNEWQKYYGQLYERIAKEKLTIIGAPYAIYHEEEYNPECFDAELAIPVLEAVKGTRELPQSLCATIALKGPYSGISGAYAKLMQWIEKEGYTIIAPPYDIYLNDPQITQPQDLITEIYFPVKKN